MRITTSFALGAALAVPAFGAGFDSLAGSTVGAGVTVPPCGAITGTVGLIVDWTHTRPGNKSLNSANGEVGALYDGASPMLCPALPMAMSATTTCRHTYNRNGSGGAKFRIQTTSTAIASGSASVVNANNGPWWWNPSIDIRDSIPTITMLRADGSVYGTAAWEGAPADAHEQVWAINTGATANPGVDGNLTPSTTSGQVGGGTPAAPLSGTMDAKTPTNIGTSTQVKSIRIDWTFQTTTNRDADNANVSSWKDVIRSTMNTSN